MRHYLSVSTTLLTARRFLHTEKPAAVSLSPLSASVRRIIREPRWAQTPGCADTLLALLSRRDADGALHPLLALEVLRGLRYAEWPGGGSSSGGTVWARRCPNSAAGLCSAEAAAARVADAVLTPLLPIAASHRRVRPLLPVLLEWALCASALPAGRWLPLLPLLPSEEGAPPAEFLLPRLAGRLAEDHSGAAAAAEAVRDMMCRVPSERRADCLFWEGEVPLLVRSQHVREAFCEQCGENANEKNEENEKKEKKVGASTMADGATQRSEAWASLAVPIEDDDAFRRLLLRLSITQHKSVPQDNAPSSPPDSWTKCETVLLEPRLQLRDPSVVLRLVAPLTDCLTAMMDTDCAPTPLRLSFAGASAIMIAALEELQRLQRTGRNSDSDRDKGILHFPLLPHKPRIHALHALTSRLLHDASRHGPVWPLFPEAARSHRIHVLRGILYTSRGLVAAVMAEKSESLRTEGTEGAAVRAGGAADTATSHNVSTALRNVAHRVLEPALLRYYTALDADVGPGIGHDVKDCVADLFQHAGGSHVLATACHVLRHPMRHDAMAVVEALRLVALQALLLRDAAALDWAREHTATAMAHAFAVAQCGGVYGEKTEKEVKEEEEEDKRESHAATVRMLCVSLLTLHQRCCAHCATADPTACRLFAMLRASLTNNGEHSDFAAIGLTAGPSDTHCAEARWALAEELATTRRRWRWLGRTSAVAAASTAAEESCGLLLPWSTVAASRHPLRLYDESKQSVAAAEAFDARVDALIRSSHSSSGPPLRFIGVKEECRFFANMHMCAEMRLSPDVTVINPDVIINDTRLKSGDLHTFVDNKDDYVDILD